MQKGRFEDLKICPELYALLIYGLPSMYTHEIKLRVRYGETDQMGYMYYGNYAELYEVGRVEMLRSLGFTYRGLEESGIILPVMELHCRYIKPARYDDELTIRTILKAFPGARITFEYELFNESRELINKGSTTLVFMNRESHKPCKPPRTFMKKLEQYFQQEV